MLYEMFQAQDDLTGPVRAMARLTAGWLGHAPRWMQASYPVRNLAAGLDVFASSAVTNKRQPFGIDHVKVGNRTAQVRERVAHSLPFGDLLHFEKDIQVEQAAAAGGRTDVGPFRHAAARHGLGSAGRPRCVHHRLA